MARNRVRVSRAVSLAADEDAQFFSSGCAILDCVLGGGWVSGGRVSNIVGDRSTGKTLLAMEAAVNFLLKFRGGHVRYVDAENAFNPSYARTIGIPIESSRISVAEDVETVEDFYEDLMKFTRKHTKRPTLYVLDSLDSLTSQAEQAKRFGKQTFDSKPRQMSELFRRIRRRIRNSNTSLMIISQTRQRIDAGFNFSGKSYSRSGGTALDFYASQVVYLRERLAERKNFQRKIGATQRLTGVGIEAFCDKNKVGLPNRRCRFPIVFDYGIDDVEAALQWLDEIGLLSKAMGTNKLHVARRRLEKLDQSEFSEERGRLASLVWQSWHDIESSFLPSRGKYT